MLPLLLLADSRLPSGGHGHSGGVEALVDRGLLRTAEDLALFLEGRVRTGGRVVAAAAAAACALAGGSSPLQESHFHATTPQEGGFPADREHAEHAEHDDWADWDAAVSARTPSAALRAASRAQGAALVRTVSLAFPTPAVAALRALPRVHHPLVLGAAAAAAGADPAQAAALALHHLVGGAATAAVRLLGLDPLRVTAVTAAVARSAEPVAADAATLGSAAAAAGDPALLPTEGSPLTDVLAELHRASEATLFAS
jgi:urease accessory protein